MSRQIAVTRSPVRVSVVHALLATLLTFGIPVAGIALLTYLMTSTPSPFVVGLVAMALAVVASTAGNVVWMRHPGSESVSFGELMLWSWLRRSHSDTLIAAGAGRLEHDEASKMTAAERLRVLREMSVALDRKDPYTYGHSRRVERFSYRTGLALSLDTRDLDVLRVAAAIHDVGKIHVPGEVLRKEGALTDAEYTAVKGHAAMGAEMVSHMGNAKITEAVRHHHERWDGRGYPDGVAGDDIPMLARIIGVADAYDAMTSTRSYRSSLGRKRAIEVLREEAGRQFDAQVVAAFLSTMNKPLAFFLTIPAVSVPSVARRVGQWFGRGSTAQVTTALGSVGIAVVISTSIAVPVGQVPVQIAAETPATAATDEVLGSRFRSERPGNDGDSGGDSKSGHSPRKQRGDKDSKPKSGSRDGGEKTDGGAGPATVVSTSSGGSKGTVGTGSISGGSSNSGSGSTPGGTGALPTDEVTEEPVSAPVKDDTQDWDPEAEADPQPEHGDDCDDNVVDTRGGAVHCDD